MFNKLLSFFSIFTTLVLILLSSCAPKKSDTTPVSQKVAENVGCENVQSKIFDSLYDYVNEKQSLPDMSALTAELENVIEHQLASQHKITDAADIKAYQLLFIDYFKSLVEMTARKPTVTKEEILQALIEFELQDQSSEQQISMNSELQTKLILLKAQSAAMQLTCKIPESIDQNGVPAATEPTIQQKISNGVSNVFAVAYQSCRALEVAPADANTPNVEGITILSTPNPENGGLQRVITSLTKVKETHPWVRVASSGSSACFNVLGSPLIYDFGGKPKWSSNIIDFFTNSGSGTSVLGVDCSGFIGSVLSAVGARYAPGIDNKPVYINQKSNKFINAKTSGFKCFENISVKSGETIKPGDIAAVEGHVLMVNSIGADPFGLKKVSSQSKCSQMTIGNFDFVLAQSSPSKNGMGINKFIAKDYLNGSDKMGNLFLDMAKASCQAAFTLKTVTPSFQGYGIIRHKGTSECMATKATLARQACVSACIK